ncbi:hypothetical protein GH714_043198 [Hevea brasiliensis]|uniref:DUF7642 domain-containing protein n=1 Tax=Hevea brasiliensis TaxID=3981 RepID=A0A6A6K5B1_HEVBR|nr:hypothetical protein GH714_043198 [Hevea brasiliensis]
MLIGCIQSVYGIHTFRVERIASGKAAPVGELQVQGVINPALLRKVIITEAAKNTQDVGKGWKPAAYTGEGKGKSRTVSLVREQLLLNRQPKAGRCVYDIHDQKIELLVEKSQTAPQSSQPELSR